MATSRPRRFATIVIALAIAAAAALWVGSGLLFGGRAPDVQKAAADLETAAPTPKVRVRTQSARPRTHMFTLQGRTEADRKVTVRAEAEGRIVDLRVEKGDAVEDGQLLARLDEGDLRARLREAEALLKQRRVELDAARRLSEKGFRAQTQLAAAEAAYEAAQAQVERVREALADTEIRAPFPGRVGARMVETGDYVKSGDAIARVIDFDPIKVVAQVSERAIGQIALGKATAETVTGQTVAGEITFIASEADQDTRTFAVEMTAANPGQRVRDGVTAVLRIPATQAPAHLVSPSILVLSDEGELGVKVLDGDNRVRFRRVEILADTREGVWLAGLPETVTFVTLGQNFVATGDRVRPVTEAAVAESLGSTPFSGPDGLPGTPGPEARP